MAEDRGKDLRWTPAAAQREVTATRRAFKELSGKLDLLDMEFCLDEGQELLWLRDEIRDRLERISEVLDAMTVKQREERKKREG